MTLWTKTDSADTSDSTVSITTVSGSKIVTGTTTNIKEWDQVTVPGNTEIAVGCTVQHVIDGTHFSINKAALASNTINGTFVHKNVAKPKWMHVDEQKKTFGVDVNEALLKPVTHTGWVKVTDYSGGRTGRKLYETIVAMGSMTSDAEDVAFPDPTITIGAQPTAQTIRLASGVNNTSPVTFGATVSVTGKGLSPTYQWTAASTSAGTYTNVTDVAGVTGISGATTNTLTLKSKLVNSKFYKLGITVAAPMGPITSLSNAAKVIGTQVTESITWATGFVTVTSTGHRLLTGDAPTFAGFTPSAYNGVHSVTFVDVNTYTYPLTTDPGVATVLGTATWADIDVNSTLACTAGVATVTTSAPTDFVTGDSVVVAGVVPIGFNGTFTLTKTGGSTFTYPVLSTPLTGVTITGIAGEFACAAGTLLIGESVTISGTYGGTGSIVGYTNPTTYYIQATNGTTTFTLCTSYAFAVAGTGGAIVTTTGTPTGLTYVGSLDNSSTPGTSTVTLVKNPTLVPWTSNIATVTAASHGLVPTDQVVIFNVTGTNYNGTKTVLTSNTNTFTYAIATAESSASVQGELYKVVA